jgi:TolB protein
MAFALIVVQAFMSGYVFAGSPLNREGLVTPNDPIERTVFNPRKIILTPNALTVRQNETATFYATIIIEIPPTEPSMKLQTTDVTSALPSTVFLWDFGDGKKVKGGASVTHQYSQVGQYAVVCSELNNTRPAEPGTAKVNVSLNQEKIVYTSGMDGNAELFVMNVDGTNPVSITPGSGAYFGPSWSSDGRHIVAEYLGTMSVMNADGSNQTYLGTIWFPIRPTWSPDGSKVAFMVDGRFDWPRGVYVINADGSNEHMVAPIPNSRYETTPNGGSWPHFWSVTWSPDGSYLAFSDDWYTYRVAADGTGLTQLAEGVWPSWSPNGSTIALTRMLPGYANDWELFTMNADGSSPVRITSFYQDGEISDISWSPDGNRIAFSAWKGADDWSIYVVASNGATSTRISGPGCASPCFANKPR